jgi:hypothetical protein
LGAVVPLLELRWRNVTERLQQALRVEPRHPFQRGVFDVVEAAPGATAVDHFRLVQPDHRLGQRVVIRVADAAHRRRRAGREHAVRVPHGDILRSTIRVDDETAVEFTVVQRLLERVEH